MMILWTSALETGIRQIDVQHQELVSMINEMEAAHASGLSTTALNSLLPRLTVYAMFHFGEEESLLAEVAEGTEFAAHHMQEHRNFEDEIQRLMASRACQSDHELAEIVSLYLADWLVLHISGTDRALARLLHAKSTPQTPIDGSGISYPV